MATLIKILEILVKDKNHHKLNIWKRAHTHTEAACDWLPASSRRCDVSAAGRRKHLEKMQRGGERRSLDALRGDTTQPPDRGVQENTHLHRADKRRVCASAQPRLCPCDGSQRLTDTKTHSSTRISRPQIDRGHPQPRQMMWDVSMWSTRSPVWQREKHLEPERCHTDRPSHHMWMLFSLQGPGGSHPAQWKVSLLLLMVFD